MGYYTDFELTVDTSGTAYSHDEINDEINKMNVFGNYGYSRYSDSWSANAKWYEHEADMAHLSSQFPGVLFTLYGNGEHSDDVWYEYYKDGNVQVCHAQITFEDYCENKMQPVQLSSDYKYSYTC